MILAANIPGLPEKHLRYLDLLELMGVPDQTSVTMAINPEYSMYIIDAKNRMIRRGNWKPNYQPLTNGHILQQFDIVAEI